MSQFIHPLLRDVEPIENNVQGLDKNKNIICHAYKSDWFYLVVTSRLSNTEWNWLFYQTAEPRSQTFLQILTSQMRSPHPWEGGKWTLSEKDISHTQFALAKCYNYPNPLFYFIWISRSWAIFCLKFVLKINVLIICPGV